MIILIIEDEIFIGEHIQSSLTDCGFLLLQYLIHHSGKPLTRNQIFDHVWEEGPGIQEQEFENITRRFYRVDPTNNEIGSGLGLSIVEWVTHAHGGQLNFINNLDKGLTVSVTLPK